MKKILMAVCVAFMGAAVFAQAEAPATANDPAPVKVEAEKAPWPIWLAINSTKHIDVIGLRVTMPYGDCESVTGFDLGFYGRCRYFEGLQANILRNEAEDVLAGIQVGIYNSAGRADLTGLQLGLFNEARSIRGFQVGLVNIANTACGIQLGLINRCESLYGFEVGGVNMIRDSDMAFLPILNIGFDVFPNY